MGIPSDGSYGIREGLIFSFPVTIQNGQCTIVQGLEIDDFSRKRLQATQLELEQESEAIADLLL
jgi:malate dehydrogenase